MGAVTPTPLQRLGRGVTLKTITTAVQVITGVSISVLLNRAYGKDIYGLLVLVYAVTGLAFATCDLGGKVTLLRYVPQQLARGEMEGAARVFGAVVLVQVAGAAAFAIVIAVLAHPIGISLYGQPSLVPLLVVGAAYAAAFALEDLTIVTFQVLQDWRRESMLSLLFGATQIAAAVLVAIVWQLGIAWVLVGHGVACLVVISTGLLCLPNAFRSALRPSRLLESGEGIRTIARFGLPLTFQGLYRYGLSWMDKLVLGPFISSGALAMYYIASSFLNGLISLFKVLPTVFAPHVAALAAADAATIHRQFTLIFRWFCQAAIVAALLMFFFVEPLVPFLYGPGYADVVPMTRALMLVFLIRACRDPFALFLQQLQGRVKQIFVYTTVLSVTSMAATVVLVPLAQIWGAIAAVVLGNVISWTVMLRMAPDIGRLVPLRTVFVSAGLVVAVCVGYMGLRQQGIDAAVSGGILIPGYVAGLWVFGEIRTTDVAIAREIARGHGIAPTSTPTVAMNRGT